MSSSRSGAAHAQTPPEDRAAAATPGAAVAEPSADDAAELDLAAQLEALLAEIESHEPGVVVRQPRPQPPATPPPPPPAPAPPPTAIEPEPEPTRPY